MAEGIQSGTLPFIQTNNKQKKERHNDMTTATDEPLVTVARGRKPSKYLTALRQLPKGQTMRVPNDPNLLASLRVCLNREGAGIIVLAKGKRSTKLLKQDIRPQRKALANVTTIHKEMVKQACTRDEAEALSKFAEKPLYWGTEIVGLEFLKAMTPDQKRKGK